MIISQNTTWAAGEIHNLSESVQIADGATLTIASGAVVNGNGYEIQAFGRLAVVGSETSRVDISNTRLSFSSNAADPGEISISFANIRNINFPSSGSNGSLNIRDSIITSASTVIFDVLNLSNFVSDSVIYHNVFIDTPRLIVSTETSAKLSIIDNTFLYISNEMSVKPYNTIINYGNSGGPVNISGNNFYVDDAAIEVQVGYKDANITADNNYFGVSRYAEIDAKIVDRSDDPNRYAAIDVNAQRLTPNPNAPELPKAQFAELVTRNILRENTKSASYEAVLELTGQINDRAAIVNDIVKLADASTSVATLSYQFFTGRAPGEKGLNYLVSSSQFNSNSNNINSEYYKSFSIENRYINFAVNLGKEGEGKATFSAKYENVSLFDTARDAYTIIFGGTPADQTLHEIIDSRVSYFAYYGRDGSEGLGTKAAMIGWLLAEAEKADVGVYALANAAYLTDLADGASFGVDLVGSSGRPEFAFG